MNKLVLYVPTYKRLDYALTLNNLSKRWRERTVIVCPAFEEGTYRKMFPDVLNILTPSIDKVPNIAAKRSWILQTTPFAKILMFDDDLNFFVRMQVMDEYKGYQQGDSKMWSQLAGRHRALTKLIKAGPAEQDRMFGRIEKMLDKYHHGGIGQRFMNQIHGHEFILNHKVTHALAYRPATVLEHCQLGRVRMFEDLDYTLQLLRRGFENAIYQWGATNDPRGFNAPGGESGTRTLQHIAKGADLMAKLHPGIVRVVERKGPDAERLGPKRIVVAWKKALKEGRAK
jgi:hypothetical protein